MYFWRNLLWLSSLSCSSLTASILLKRVTRESCNALACLFAAGQLILFSSGSEDGIWRSEKTAPLQLLPRLLAKGLDILARSPRAHGPHVVWPDL